MGNGIRVKKKHLFYNLNRKRTKSHKKLRKAFEWYITVMKKKERPGFEKWVEKTLVKVKQRFVKYGITSDMLKEYLSKKGLEKLYVDL
jgi:hypothetical protein